MKKFMKCMAFAVLAFSILAACNQTPTPDPTPSQPDTPVTPSEVRPDGQIDGFSGGHADIPTGTESEEYEPPAALRDIVQYKPEAQSEALVLEIDMKNCTVNKTAALYSDLTIDGNITFRLEDSMLKVDASAYEGDSVRVIMRDTAATGLSVTGSGQVMEVSMEDTRITTQSVAPVSIKGFSFVTVHVKGVNSLSDGRRYGTGYSRYEGDDFFTSSYQGFLYATEEGSNGPIASVVDFSGKYYDADGDRAYMTRTWAKGTKTAGALYSDCPMVIDGTGSLTLSSGYKYGIASDDFIRVEGGTLKLTCTGKCAIHAVNGFVMTGGSVTILGSGTQTNNPTRGITVEGRESEETPGEGFVSVSGGILDITCPGKGIYARWQDIPQTDATEDDPYPHIEISGGTVNVRTTGSPMENPYTSTYYDSDGVTVTGEIYLSPDGIAADRAILVSGGTVNVNCSGLCFHTAVSTGSVIGISGGYVYACSSTRDAFLSEGDIRISGGRTIAYAVSSSRCAFRCGDRTLAFTGGFVFALGTDRYSEPTPGACTQGVLVMGGKYASATASLGSTIALKDAEEKCVYALKTPTTVRGSNFVAMISDPGLRTGGTYTLVLNPTFRSGSQEYGIYSVMPDIIAGASYKGVSFETDSVFTALANNRI